MHTRTSLCRNTEFFRASQRGLKYSSASLSPHRSRTIIYVEGNIASGKSSIMEYVKSIATPVNKRKGANSPVLILPEPIEKWVNLNGKNMLKLFYADKKSTSAIFQTYVHLTLLQQAVEASRKRNARIILSERSLLSGRFVFSECLHANGEMTDEERAVLDHLFCFHWKQFERQLKPDIIVYLRTSPSICLQRIQVRNRDGEAALQLDYLQRLHELHERLFARRLAHAGSEVYRGHPGKDVRSGMYEPADSCLQDIPVIVVDADRSIEAVQHDFVERVSNVMDARQAATLFQRRVTNPIGTKLTDAHSIHFEDAIPPEGEVESEEPREIALSRTSG